MFALRFRIRHTFTEHEVKMAQPSRSLNFLHRPSHYSRCGVVFFAAGRDLFERTQLAAQHVRAQLHGLQVPGCMDGIMVALFLVSTASPADPAVARAERDAARQAAKVAHVVAALAASRETGLGRPKGLFIWKARMDMWLQSPLCRASCTVYLFA